MAFYGHVYFNNKNILHPTHQLRAERIVGVRFNDFVLLIKWF